MALDLILSRTYDTPHSEWEGLGRHLQQLLVGSILTSSGLSGYLSAFQHFTVPSDSESKVSWLVVLIGAWPCDIIMTPLILRCYASPAWFKEAYRRNANDVLRPLFSHDNSFSPMDLVIHSFACFAVAVSAVSMPIHNSPADLHDIVLKGRRVYQGLIRGSSAAQDLQDAGSTDNRIRLPNLHIGLHLSEFAAEYGPLMNCNVLEGELKHKSVLIYDYVFLILSELN
jgi:hypothetical protein